MSDTWVDTLPQDKVDRWLSTNGEAAKKAYYTDDARFALWMHYVNRFVMHYAGLGALDLPDYRYYDEYEVGTPPKDVAVDLLAENGFDVEGEE